MFSCLRVSAKPFTIANVKIQHVYISVTMVTLHPLDNVLSIKLANNLGLTRKKEKKAKLDRRWKHIPQSIWEAKEHFPNKLNPAATSQLKQKMWQEMREKCGSETKCWQSWKIWKQITETARREMAEHQLKWQESREFHWNNIASTTLYV